MIFDRKKKKSVAEEEVVDPVAGDELPEETALVDEELAEDDLGEEMTEDDAADDVDDVDDEDEDEDELDDEDASDDASSFDHDLMREDGPFDIDEVDLDADDIDRLDFGSVVITPFENMQLQLQVDQETGAVQSALVMVEQSAIEIALFAAPSRSSMVPDVADEMVSATVAAGGEAELGEGPFGPEIRRVIPVEADGQQGYHISRTWFAQGPRWLLRGVLMGEAALQEGFDSGAGELLFEFFCNLVVRRDAEPRVPGDIIPMTLPDELAQSAQA